MVGICNNDYFNKLDGHTWTVSSKNEIVEQIFKMERLSMSSEDHINEDGYTITLMSQHEPIIPITLT